MSKVLHSLLELADIKNQLIETKPRVVKNTTSSNEFIYLFNVNGEVCKIVKFSGSYLDKHTKLSRVRSLLSTILIKPTMKYVVTIGLILLGLFVSNWIFNHINPWLGILSYIILLGLIINFIIKQLKT